MEPVTSAISDHNESRPASLVVSATQRDSSISNIKRPYHLSHTHSIADLVSLYFCPWQRDRFPGMRRVILATLPRKYDWSAVQHWRAGRRRLPVPVAEAWVALLQARIATAQALIAALQAHIDETPLPTPRGFMQVDESGRDKRGNWRR